MRQHSRLGVSCATTCELEICDVIRAYYAIEDVEDMVWYAFGFLDELVVLDEVAVFSTYQTNCLQVWQYGRKVLLVECLE